MQITQPGPDTFLELADTPNSYSSQSGKKVSVKSTEDGLEFSQDSSSITLPIWGLFDLNGDGDLEPNNDATQDEFFELVGGQITPRTTFQQSYACWEFEQDGTIKTRTLNVEYNGNGDIQPIAS